MKKVAALLALCGACSGCAAEMRWINEQHPNAIFEVDREACEQESLKGARISRPELGAPGAADAPGIITSKCLKQRGWRHLPLGEQGPQP